MQLSNTFTVGVPLEEAWATLLDLERVAPCLPGAAITDVDGTDYHGGVKIKVGPITAQYRGTASYVETDPVAHRAVISARGKDVGGQGNAEATIVATLTQFGDGTRVQVDTDLDLSGRVAQFGRGVIGDVTGRLLTQFSKNLEAEFCGKAAGVSDLTSRSAKPRRKSLEEVEPLDIAGGVVGASLVKYAAPVLVGVVAVALAAWVGSRVRRDGHAPALRGAPVAVYLTLPSNSDEEGKR